MPLLADPEALTQTIDLLAEWAEERRPQVVIGGEARGFFIGSAIAYKLGCGFVPARRPGKLPLETISAEYALEYGRNTLELQADAFAGARLPAGQGKAHRLRRFFANSLLSAGPRLKPGTEFQG